MGFLRQEHWTGLPFPSPGDLPDPGIQLASRALQVISFTNQATREAPLPEGVVYKDLNPGIAGKGWPTHPVSQSSPTRGSQLQKMGLVVPARCKEQVWA